LAHISLRKFENVLHIRLFHHLKLKANFIKIIGFMGIIALIINNLRYLKNETINQKVNFYRYLFETLL